MDGKQLGKIKAIDIIEEYNNIYLQVELGSDIDHWGVFNSYPFVNPQEANHFPLVQYMKDAGVVTLSKLVGKPVEATFERNTLKSWRILKEVL